MPKTVKAQDMSLLRPPFRIPTVTGTYPPRGAVVRGVYVQYRLSNAGYYMAIDVQWSDLESPGHSPQTSTVPDWSWRSWVPYATRPSLRRLVQNAARAVWDISMAGPIVECEGQDPLPGL